MPCEWELREEMGVRVVVFLEGSAATSVLFAGGGAGVVVRGGGWAECVGETAARGVVDVHGGGYR